MPCFSIYNCRPSIAFDYLPNVLYLQYHKMNVSKKSSGCSSKIIISITCGYEIIAATITFTYTYEKYHDSESTKAWTKYTYK